MRRHAFTLVELMVTMAIIALLATFLIGSLYMAQQAAKADRTRAIIAKLDIAMKQRWESYQWRSLPLGVDEAIANWNAARGSTGPAYSMSSLQDQAAVKLNVIREMMRMEIPSRWSDLDGNCLFLKKIVQDSSRGNIYWNGSTSLGFRNWSWHQAMKGTTGVNGVSSAANPLGSTGATNYNKQTNVSAEFLYITICNSFPGAESARGSFGEWEIGDTDQDGALEFLDGWGNPIYFQRWVPGFTPLSDIQRNDPQNSHDPYDHRRTDQFAYALYPLIYSVGPDGKSGLGMGLDSPEHSYATPASRNNPFSNKNIGEPTTTGSEVGRHFDNIHNHVLRSR